MPTLIYVCYVALFTTPVKQECHIEEIHNPPNAVYQWCRELRELDSGRHNEVAVTQCHEYNPGEENRDYVYIHGRRQ